ncbi:putative ABC transport system permease protein [Streptomyces sp. DSM 42143]|uniref:FtsX-like permease family protein n=1 Tax=Streptomyces sp. DSM 42143 TaxID=2817711 RepID=UPI00277E2493|nr:FtsX-like permease family protein [Streptomyces sp. DSM 42143]MDQ0385956.1 putative ABC transport system permease protein [Streptomyces sp. DSM 42143]
MLTVTLHTLRTRWATLVGSFVALSLGVALLTVTGLALASSLDAPDRAPERFAAAPVVVRGLDALRVPTPVGDRTERLARPRAVPAGTVAELRRLGRVVEDRSFAVRAERGPGDLVGHPWSTAAFAPYGIDAGRAPRAADEVVVTGDWAAPGERLRTDRGVVEVVGTVPDRGFENAVFYTDAEAARLSPVSLQLVVDADASAVRDAVRGSAGVRVLTGDERRYADADPERDSEAMTAMNALFGTSGGVSAFVSVFVVASTFAFAVAQRRREFGLLRTAGATPGQVRRTVLAEGLAVGAVASAAGCALGSYGAPHLAAWVVDEGLAPAWFSIGDHTWPYHTAFWTGLLVALCGAVTASWRAGRTGPAQALREVSVDTRTMTRGRWLSGGGLLLTALVTLGIALAGDPGDLLHRKTYVTRPMLLITAVALLAPVVVRPLTRLLAWLPARLPGAAGMLVRENAAAGVRRTAAVAAPVLVTVALAGSLLGATATLNEAGATETRERTTADFVVEAPGDGGFDAETVDRLRAVPGTATVSPASSTAVYVLEEGVALVRSDARAVADPAALSATARLPLAAGRATDLDDGSIIVNEEWERHSVGESVRVWLGDGTERKLRIAAVMTTGTGDNGAYVTSANAPGVPVDRVDVTVAAGADAGAVADGLRDAVGPSGGQVSSRDEWVAATSPQTNGTTRAGLLLVLGIALLYTGISLVNTMVMATSDRTRDLAVLRLTGATRWQVLRLVGAESLTVVVVGAVLGLVVAVLNLAGMWAALRHLSVHSAPDLPWTPLAGVVATCAVLAVTASVIPAGLALRRHAAESAGVRE